MANVVIPFLLKLVGAVALWILGGWCIKIGLGASSMPSPVARWMPR